MDVELLVTYTDVGPQGNISYWENTYNLKRDEIFANTPMRRNSLMHFESIGTLRVRITTHPPKPGYDLKYVAATKGVIPMGAKIKIAVVSVLSAEDMKKLKEEVGNYDSSRIVNEISPLEN